MMEKKVKGQPLDADTEEALQTGKEKMCDVLKAAVERRKQDTVKHSERQLIDVLAESELSDEVKFADVIATMIGGFQIIGYLMTWMHYFLCANPHVEEKVIHELKTVTRGGEVTPGNRKKLAYMKQVISETIRCVTLTPLAIRPQVNSSVLGSYNIPANSHVIDVMGVTMKDPAAWPEPDKFNPSRFEGNSVAGHIFEFFDFAGKKLCPGLQFAFSAVTVVMATTLYKVKLTLADDDKVKLDNTCIAKPKNEIYVSINPREEGL